jgi:radical SAM protein with 4Fe4S-binding SPASM domain
LQYHNNGDVRPCTNSTVVYGNILNDELKNIWKKMSDWRTEKYVPEKCKKCTWLNRCLGGCRTNAKTFSGTWDGQDIWTAKPLKTPPPLHKKRVEFTNDIKLKINPNYFYRQEYKDIFVVYNVKNNMYFMINRVYFDLIENLKKENIVLFGELQKKYNVTNNDKAFFDAINLLVQYQVLKIIE